MAQLHYQNLDIRRPDILMKRAFYGLKPFYDFLSRTKKYMESDDAVKRLAWSKSQAQEGDEASSIDGVWVQLEEPRDRPNEPDSTFMDFLDENVREVYELPDPNPAEDARGARRQMFSEGRKILIRDRDPLTYRLLLERAPKGSQLLLRPNTITLHRQMQALQALQNEPAPFHKPLLRIFETSDHAQWPAFDAKEIDDWLVLTDAERPGTEEQRRFVKRAMATPDFMVLEGPPGSGKTTAICELILQLAREGKRVLLCASTHVAVDNVLERLMDERNSGRDLMIPVRIGDRSNVSEKARSWQFERFVKTERERILAQLRKQKALSESQKMLLEAVRHEASSIERMVLDAANLVCGTTIGILQHPDIKSGNGSSASVFDVLIVDEASKTTFQEFLVPALYAKRWVIVGDPKQLSPYVDDVGMAVNIEACLPDEDLRNACIDVFKAGRSEGPKKRRVAVVSIDSDKAKLAYLNQSAERTAQVVDASDSFGLFSADVVIGTTEEIERFEDDLPLDVATIRAPSDALDTVRRRANAWLKLNGRGREETPEWSDEVAWRLSRSYEQRFSTEEGAEVAGLRRLSTGQKLRDQLEQLLPVATQTIRPENVWDNINQVRRVALPSILESLRYGFERGKDEKAASALTDGLPEDVIEDRHVLLSTQHRMHPEIAAFSHEHVYHKEALFTPPEMVQKRNWSYGYGPRSVWRDVRGGFNGRMNSNPKEVHEVLSAIKDFDDWASQHPQEDGEPWTVAILTFYRGQEREVRKGLRKWSGQGGAIRHFSRSNSSATKRRYLEIELCTVDRFQGHEADFVIISIASARPTSFLESPNRLNVALTRARYQRIIVGDRHAMRRAYPSLLGVLASEKSWESKIVEGGHHED